MSTTRLTFLYPHLFRSVRTCEPTTQTLLRRPQLPPRQCMKARGFAKATRREQRFVERHGKAVEPFVADAETADGDKLSGIDKEAKEAKESGTEKGKAMNLDKKGTTNEGQEKTTPISNIAAEPLSEETQAAGEILKEHSSLPFEKVAVKEAKTPIGQKTDAGPGDIKTPTETILEMPPPKTHEQENAMKPPHLQTPPYVHHFDTYSLVQQVEKGGFTMDQSITAMKAVRALLAKNLDVAKAGLVSKSDVENETYLFRAACSELKTEVQNNRKQNEESMRRERTLLQHEVDILNQKLTQELLGLKDDLKGMFDDRKMAVRQEQRAMESAIQEINYKITVSLNSDSKSEVEGLRWILTRRSVIGILIMAFMVLTSLRYASYKSHEAEERRKKLKKAPKKDDQVPRDLSPHNVAEILTAN
ncbi:hypothetical protein HYFRA_00005317 [Hymenoscyphus fraxineus]|uniref:MOZ protein represents a chromatin-associated acetyltransferase n=1 Tax=Hymenoscyphus fraxineus TaxID=746836 RepID=A0A9N9LF31_9HELO|nr:hypothetical protein HYFRA_00005317 [Hymenoscyphus fraxineus]